MKLQDFNSSYLCGKNIFADVGFQNMIVNQSTFKMSELKIDKVTEYVPGWKSKFYFNENFLNYMVILC